MNEAALERKLEWSREWKASKVAREAFFKYTIQKPFALIYAGIDKLATINTEIGIRRGLRLFSREEEESQRVLVNL